MDQVPVQSQSDPGSRQLGAEDQSSGDEGEPFVAVTTPIPSPERRMGMALAAVMLEVVLVVVVPAVWTRSQIVNLNLLINSFPSLLLSDHDDARQERAHRVTDLTAPLPPVDHHSLSLSPPDGLGMVQDLPAAVAELRRLACRRPALEPAAQAAEILLAARDDIRNAMRENRPVVTNPPTAAFRTAERLAALIGGAVALQFWLQNRAAHENLSTLAGRLWTDGVWLRVVLDRMLSALDLGGPPCDAAYGIAADVLAEQVARGHLPSLFTVPLVEATHGPADAARAGARGPLRPRKPGR
jgi:hypothetical protein